MTNTAKHALNVWQQGQNLGRYTTCKLERAYATQGIAQQAVKERWSQWGRERGKRR